MLQAQIINGPALGLSEDKDFACSANVCRPLTEATKTHFKYLQTNLNRFAKKAGFTPVTVNGNIGPATASAGKAAALVVRAGDVPYASVALIPLSSFDMMPKDIAEDADNIGYALNEAADYMKVQLVPPPVPGTTKVTTAPERKKTEEKKTNWVLWAAVGVLALASVTAVYTIYQRTSVPEPSYAAR